MNDLDLDVATSTVSQTALVPFVRLLEEAGARAVEAATALSERVLARWGIGFDEVEHDPRRRLPHGLVVELLDVFVEVLGDPSAPLRAGTKLQFGDYELLEYLCGSCGTLGESIACLGRYYPLLINAEHELRVEGERAEARFRIAPGLAAPDAMHEFALASNFTMSALHLQVEGSRLPIEVCFAHRAPEYAGLFPQLFFAPVRFECGYNALVFPVSMLAQPMRTADPLLHAVLTRLADQELGELVDQSAFPLKVRQAIEAVLPAGAPLPDVAARLHMSPSAVRSRLRQHGLSYSALLDRLRRDRAQRALRQSQQSVAEIGHDLGFAHPPAFNRAFRRWFGVTPNAYREAPATHPATRFFRRPS
ncbi:MAG: AraC family transcriptional regulator ligand-binding domain-containing protein [Polyangiales bacterium]